jgi:hypothetical protein
LHSRGGDRLLNKEMKVMKLVETLHVLQRCGGC